MFQAIGHRHHIYITIVLLLLPLLGACESKIDEKIEQYRGPDDTVVGLRSMSDVIEAFGSPDEVWGSMAGPEIVFIYEGKKVYSVLFVMGSFPFKLIEGRLGGRKAVPVNVPYDFKVRGNSIDLQRR